MTLRVPLVAANWKMHKTIAEARDFLAKFRPLIEGLREVDVALAPPFTALAAVGEALQALPVHLAAQNVADEPQGALTGEVSPLMLREVGCQYVIVGHSERRTRFGETDELVHRKLKIAFQHGLIPILCVGERLEQRRAGRTEAVLEGQLRSALAGVAPRQAAKLVVAYEPLWAIGTGQSATPEDAQGGCAFARAVVEGLFKASVAEAVRVQYGGSVKPDNAEALLRQPDVDGALVGGASLDPRTFAKVVWRAKR